VTAGTFSRRGAVALLASTFALAACGRKDESQVLKVGSQRGGTKALMLSSGALDGISYQVEWSEFPAAQNLLEAIGSGAIDVGLAGDAPFQFAYQSGSPIKAVSAQVVQPRPTEAVSLVVPPHAASPNTSIIRTIRANLPRIACASFSATSTSGWRLMCDRRYKSMRVCGCRWMSVVA